MFDRVIRFLGAPWEFGKVDYGLGADPSVVKAEVKAAIRVLEAAGKVDRKLAITSIHETIFESDDPWREDDPIFQAIYALLSSLPDAKDGDK